MKAIYAHLDIQGGFDQNLYIPNGALLFGCVFRNVDIQFDCSIDDLNITIHNCTFIQCSFPEYFWDKIGRGCFVHSCRFYACRNAKDCYYYTRRDEDV